MMTLEDLEDHAAGLRGCLEDKRWSLRTQELSVRTIALVGAQIEALDLRVKEIERQCQTIRDARALAGAAEAVSLRG
jgi:hypothetical protein